MEIGSNSCVDRGQRRRHGHRPRAPSSTTWSTSGTTSASGERCLLMAGVGIAGSTRIGNDVILAGHVGVTDHLRDRRTGHGSRPRAPCSATSRPGASFSGHPARPHRQFLRAQAALYRAGADHRASSSGWCRSAEPRWLGARWRATAEIAGHRPAHRARARPRAASAAASGQGIVFRRIDLPGAPDDSGPRRRGAVHRAAHRAGRRRGRRCRPWSTCSPPPPRSSSTT